MPDLQHHKHRAQTFWAIPNPATLFVLIFNLEVMSATERLHHCTKETSHRQFCSWLSNGLAWPTLCVLNFI